MVSLSKESTGGFLIRTANDESIRANKVVVATGIIPFAYVPPELSGLPPDSFPTHRHIRTWDETRGKEVLVVGGGSSALETSALLLEQGARSR